MKRLGSSDSLGALISICPSSDDDQKTPGNSNTVYSRGFQSMLEGLEEGDCSLEEEQGGVGGGGQKKRRLSVDQVKALEKNFEVENKLEPDRKVKLAHELGLQPRQVAVWFQNRRARWKTKQLERDYGILKSNFDSLKQDFQALQQDKEALLTELRELKSKIHGEEIESTNHSIEEEKRLKSEPEKISLMNETTCYNNNGGGGIGGISVFGDGSSDSDSSAILNEEININNSPISSSGGGCGGHVLHQQLLNNMSPPPPPLPLPLLPHASSFNCSTSSSPSSINCFQFSDSRGISTNTQSDFQHQQQSQPFVRMEEHNFFGAEEVTCNFFSDEQAPTLQCTAAGTTAAAVAESSEPAQKRENFHVGISNDDVGSSLPLKYGENGGRESEDLDNYD